MVLVLRSEAPDWTQAKCVHEDPTKVPLEILDLHFDENREEEALAMCNGLDGNPVCPIRHECLLFSLKNNEKDGIWGGMTVEDRTYMRRFIPKEQWEWQEPKSLEEQRNSKAS